MKGEFRWEKNVQPDYFWFNGSINAITARDVIDPSRPVAINWSVGSRGDENARIFPFKVHEGKQPYDKINKTLLIPKLFGPKGSGAYWAEYDWKKALDNGMQAAGLPFSGEFDFVETAYVFPITHMVAPKENAVACIECHARKGGWPPGRVLHARPGQFQDDQHPRLGAGSGTLVGVTCTAWDALFPDAARRINDDRQQNGKHLSLYPLRTFLALAADGADLHFADDRVRGGRPIHPAGVQDGGRRSTMLLGLTWLIAFAFFVFWLLTTGEWKQYIPTTKKMFTVIRYYGFGIFRGEPHPVPKRKDAKHNPLQRLTYLSVAALLLPLQMLTGFLYWSYNSWDGLGLDVEPAPGASIHTWPGLSRSCRFLSSTST